MLGEPPMRRHVNIDFQCWIEPPVRRHVRVDFPCWANRPCGGMSAWISCAGRTACAAARPRGFSAPDCRRNVFYLPVSAIRAVFRGCFFNSAFLGFIGSGKDRPFPARDLGLRPELVSQRPVFRLFPNAFWDCPPQSQSQQRICGLTSLLAGVIMSAGGSCRLRDSAAEWSGFHRRVLGAKP